MDIFLKFIKKKKKPLLTFGETNDKHVCETCLLKFESNF